MPLPVVSHVCPYCATSLVGRSRDGHPVIVCPSCDTVYDIPEE